MKFWSWIYRLTGWYSPWASAAELKSLKKYIFNIMDNEKTTKSQFDLLFKIDVHIGMWQGMNGFVRKAPKKIERKLQEKIRGKKTSKK